MSAPHAFATVWKHHRAEFLAGIGGADRYSRVRTAQALRSCSSILDIGCGPGLLLETLRADRGEDPLSYVGVDAVPDMLPPGPQFAKADAERLPFDDRSFDGVVLRHVLEHLADPLPALRDAMRVCRRLLVVGLSQWPTAAPRAVLADSHLGAHRWAHPLADLRDALTDAGFAILEEEWFDPSANAGDRLEVRETLWTYCRIG